MLKEQTKNREKQTKIAKNLKKREYLANDKLRIQKNERKKNNWLNR